MPSDVKRCPKCNTPTDLGALECRQCHYAFRMVVMGSRPYEAEFEAQPSQQRGRQGQSVPPPIIIDLDSSPVNKRRFRMRRHHWNLIGVVIACLFLLYTMSMLRDVVRETVRASQPDYVSQAGQPPPPPFSPQIRAASVQPPDPNQNAHIEIVNYLAALHRFEDTKQAILERGSASIRAIVQAKQSSHSIQEDNHYRSETALVAQRTADDLTGLRKDFLRTDPPRYCLELHNDYTEHLAAVEDYLAKADYAGTLDQVAAAKRLEELEKEVKARQVYSTRMANQELQNVCRLNNISLDFSIYAK